MSTHEDTHRIELRVRVACYAALAALALIVWSLVHPAPLAVVGAMSVGQGLGTLSLALFVYAIVADLRRTWRRAQHMGALPKAPEPTKEEPPANE